MHLAFFTLAETTIIIFGTDTEESAEPFSSGRQLVKYPLAKFVVDIQVRSLETFSPYNFGLYSRLRL